MLNGVLKLDWPAGEALPFIVDSPHSGRIHPPDFRSVLSREQLAHAEDAFVDTLFARAPFHGACFLRAMFPRSYIDLNRAESDIDLQLVKEGKWPGPCMPSEKTRQGNGLVWRLCPPGLPVYGEKLGIAEIQHRITEYWQPYHTKLKMLYDRRQAQFGQVWHLNCHSMPSGAVENAGKLSCDFVLGDLGNRTCRTEFRNIVHDFLTDLGYAVGVNWPYRGAWLIEAYSNARAGRHALQIEINRKLYMNEETVTPHGGYESLREHMNLLMARISSYIQTQINKRHKISSPNSSKIKRM